MSYIHTCPYPSPNPALALGGGSKANGPPPSVETKINLAPPVSHPLEKLDAVVP
jgi:hypothetical protein